MIASISKTYTFSAAHFLTGVADEHPCSAMHGHNYEVVVEVEGLVGSDGMVMDYGELDELVKPVVEKLDHTTLNVVLANPTAENLAIYLLGQLRCSAVTVCETPRTTATVRAQ